jgi:hypothetical protein
MKANYLIQILIWGLAPLQIYAQIVPEPEVYGSSSDFTVVAAGGGNGIHKSSLDNNFTASGSAESPTDFSSVSGAQAITYGLGTFTGSGHLDAIAGEYEGQPSMSVSGETSVDILFSVPSTMHFQYVSEVVTSDNIYGEIVFNGFTNSGGTVTASGNIGTTNFQGQTNLFDLEVTMAQGNGSAVGTGSWSYKLSLTPSRVMAGRFTAAQKADFYAQASSLTSLGAELYAMSYKVSSGPLRTDMQQASVAVRALALGLEYDFLDPLDTNYTIISQAAPLPVTPLAVGNGITQLGADDYNAWLTNLSLSAGYGAALTTSLNRAQGAAFAGNSFWDTAQMNAAVQWEAQLAALLDQEPVLRSNLVVQLESDGFPEITVTTNDVLALQAQISTNGLPADMLAVLTAMGDDADAITNFQNILLTVDPATMAGSFPGSFVNTNLDSTAQTLASGLRDASLVLINATVLPGGQFRFDLPTEPGYTYTIQYAQDLANPAGWTKLLTNHAATTLLSFTNTPGSNAPGGYYRASHN